MDNDRDPDKIIRTEHFTIESENMGILIRKEDNKEQKIAKQIGFKVETESLVMLDVL